MSKKKKDIEVNVSEETMTRDGKTQTITKLTIGKKEVGKIIPLTDKKWAVEMNDKQETLVKNVDEGIAYIIRQWNLHAAQA